MEPSGNGTWSLRVEDGDGEDDINDDDDDGGKVLRLWVLAAGFRGQRVEERRWITTPRRVA